MTSTTLMGVSQAKPPTQTWSVHELQDMCVRDVTSGPAKPEDPESPRRSHIGKKLNDKFPIQSQQTACSLGVPLSTTENI